MTEVKMVSKEVQNKDLIDLGNIRMLAIRRLPYLAYWLTSLVPVRINLPFAWMAVDDKGRLYYNEDVMKENSLADNVVVILHEVLHMVLGHPKTAETLLSPYKEHENFFIRNACSQLAGDFVVDGILADPSIGIQPGDDVKRNFRLPQDFGLPEKKGMVDYYYMLLEAYEKPNEAKNKNPNVDTKKIKDVISLIAKNFEAFCNKPNEEGNGPGNQSGCGDDSEKRKSMGGGSDIVPRPWNMGPIDTEGKPIFPEDAPGIPKDRQERLNRATKRALEVFVRRNGIGTVPGEFVRQLDEAFIPKVNPFDYLASVVRHRIELCGAGAVPDYNKPRRKPYLFPQDKLILPRYRKPKVRTAFLFDTSGSMTKDQLSLGLGAVMFGLHSLGELDVYCADAELQGAQKVRNISEIKLLGGGGTDMGAAIEAILENEDYQNIIVLTDGYTPWCERPKKTHVIVALTDPSNESSVPDWATVVKLESA